MSYVFTHMCILRNLIEDYGRRKGRKKIVTNREGWRQIKRQGKWVMGIEEGHCWDEHWVLYVSQFDNKLYLK